MRCRRFVGILCCLGSILLLAGVWLSAPASARTSFESGAARIAAEGHSLRDPLPAGEVAGLRQAAKPGVSFTFRSLDGNYANCTGVGAADLNGDGRLDILSATAAGNGAIHGWIQAAGGTFTQTTVDAAFRGATAFYAADRDKDGDADLTAISGLYGRLARYESTPTGWDKTDYSALYSPTALARRGIDIAPTHYELLSLQEPGRVPAHGIHLGITYRVADLTHPASALASGNLDRSGEVDLVAVSRDGDFVVWFPDRGSGAKQVIDAAFPLPTWVEVADIDGDGDDDVASASDSRGVWWWENRDGKGTQWGKWPIMQQERYGGSSLHLVDLDRDGDLDLMGATREALVWLENLGTPSYHHNWLRHHVETHTVSTLRGYVLFPADVDRDGRLDIVGCDALGGPTGYRLGWWESRQVLPGGDQIIFEGWDITNNLVGAWGVGISDFNADGRLDVAAAGYGNNDADGQTGWWASGPGAPLNWTKAYTATFDKGRGVTPSGRTYAVSGNAYTGQVREFSGGGLNWQAPSSWTPLVGLTDTYQVAIADLNADGIRDFVGASADSGEIVWAPSLSGGGGWGTAVLGTGCAGARGLSVGDLDGDGDLDVAAACENKQKIHWWQNISAGTTWTAKQIPVAFPGATDVKCGDVNGDGVDEVVAANSDVAWFTPNASPGDGATMGWITNVFTGTEHIALHDIDRDGDLDVVASSYTLDKLAWLENTGTGGYLDDFALHEVDEATGGIRQVAAGDLDGDGAPDLAAAMQDAGRVRWYRQTVPTELSIEKSLDTAQSTGVISTGGSIPYVVEVTNNSYSGATADVWVVDTWEPPEAVIDAAADADCLTDPLLHRMVCRISIPAGRIQPLQIEITPSLNFDGWLTNTVQVLPVAPAVNTTAYLDRASAAAVDVQQDVAIWDGQASLGAMPGLPVAPGATFTTTLGVVNLGPKSPVTATLINTWSPVSAIDGFALLGTSPAGRLSAESAATQVTCETDDVADGIVCDVTNLAAGSPMTITVGITTAQAFTDVLRADLSLSGPDGDERNAGNNASWPRWLGTHPLKRVYLPLALRH